MLLYLKEEANLILNGGVKMRRMYSEKELSEVISAVLEEEIEAGTLDDAIAGAVEDYLIENPVDITVLNGKTITPAVVNASTSISAPSATLTAINGESNPSLKPIYYHPIYVEYGLETRFMIAILNNVSSAYSNWSAIYTEMKRLMDLGAQLNVNGFHKDSGAVCQIIRIGKLGSPAAYILDCIKTSTGDRVTYDLDNLVPGYTFDGVNKIN